MKNLGPGGKWDGTVGIYRENSSAKTLGIFDADLIAGLPESVKWIAHNVREDPIFLDAILILD